MYSPESQKAEIEKLKKAVSESVRARRAFRISKKPPRVSQNVADLRAAQAEGVSSGGNGSSSTQSTYSFEGLSAEAGPASVVEPAKQHRPLKPKPEVTATELLVSVPNPSTNLSFLAGVPPAGNLPEYTMVSSLTSSSPRQISTNFKHLRL